MLRFIMLLLVAGILSGQQITRIRKVQETQWNEGPLDSTAVDWSLFPRAYGVLASERLMYPVDMADWPVQLGPERQLFVDNDLVAAAFAVRRTVHQPRKHPANPIMIEQGPLEKDLIVQQVLRDPASGRFRMWYSSWVNFLYPGTRTKGRFPTLYAESQDGVHWERPNLGLVELQGSRENNVVLLGSLTGLFYDPEAKDPDRRYLAGVWHEPPYVPREGDFLYASPDGVRWKRVREDPLFPYLEKNGNFPLQGLGDTTKLRFDPVLKLYVADAKILFPNPVFRARGIATSPDLIHWTRPRMTIYPDSQDDADAQIYGQISFPYESLWLGMLRVYHMARAGRKQTDVELTVSHDGLHWSRVANREVFIPLGKEESWERDYTDPAASGPLLVGDELWFYYRGTRFTPENAAQKRKMATGLAKLRRDGFVSIDASDQPGWLLTRPLTARAAGLHVNADVQRDGSVRVALIGRDGKPLAGYSAEDSIPLTAGSTDVSIRWKNGGDLRELLNANEHIRIRFELANASLYAFWLR